MQIAPRDGRCAVRRMRADAVGLADEALAMHAATMQPRGRVVSVRRERVPRAVLGASRPLVWRTPPAPGDDLPPIVRAGSALRRWDDAWVVIQDDVRALAVVRSLDTRYAQVHAEPLLLPALHGVRTFDDLRGNKAAKLDLEASLVLPDGRLLVIGSGATRVRERFVLVEAHAAGPRAHVVEASALYARLRQPGLLRGVAMNLEGAVVIGGSLRVFQRGVGVPADQVAPTAPTANATIDLPLRDLLAWLDRGAAPPHVENVMRYDLGLAEGAVIGFTDAALLHDGTVAFLACAELTGDPTVDGRVVATRFGVLDADGGWQSEVVDERGERVLDKLEGLEPGEAAGCFHVVTDADDAATPARIARLDAALGPGVAPGGGGARDG